MLANKAGVHPGGGLGVPNMSRVQQKPTALFYHYTACMSYLS